MGWGYAALSLGLLLLCVSFGLYVTSMTLSPRSATGVKGQQMPTDGSSTSIRLVGEHHYGLITDDDLVSCTVTGPQGEQVEVRTSAPSTWRKVPERLHVRIDRTATYEVSCTARSTVAIDIANSDPSYQRVINLFLAAAPTLVCSIPLVLGGGVAVMNMRRRRARELANRAMVFHADPRWAASGAAQAHPAPMPAPVTPPPYASAYPRSVYGAAAHPGQAPQARPTGQTAPPSPQPQPSAQHPYAQ